MTPAEHVTVFILRLIAAATYRQCSAVSWRAMGFDAWDTLATEADIIEAGEIK